VGDALARDLPPRVSFVADLMQAGEAVRRSEPERRRRVFALCMGNSGAAGMEGKNGFWGGEGVCVGVWEIENAEVKR
jgi:hypothetical protein